MKVLWLSLESEKERLTGFTEQLGNLCDLSAQWLTPRAAKHAVKAVGAKQIKQFDRVLVHLPLPMLVKQTPYLRCVPNILFLPSDLADFLMAKSTMVDRFLKALAVMPWARVLVPYGAIKPFLNKKHVDAVEVPIGFNQEQFNDVAQDRAYFAVILANVGKPENKFRKHLLFDIKTHNKLQLFDVDEGEALNHKLNQTGIVVLNDQDCFHYRSINFQAMAAGALVLTWDRGERENQACGFRDMENILFYNDKSSAHAKLNFMKRHPQELEKIRQQGKLLAISLHSNKALAENVFSQLQKPLSKFTGDDVEKAVMFGFFR